MNETAVIVSWVTNQATTFNGSAVPANAVDVTTSLRLDNMANSGAKVTPLRSANYTYMFDNTPATANAPGATNYRSGVINSVLLSNLQPGETYTYTLIDENGTTMRSNLNFTMPPGVGEPSRFVLIGDLGQSHNSTDTLFHIVQDGDADMIVFTGDLSYADHVRRHASVFQ